MLATPACLADDGGLAGPIWGEGPESNGAGGSKDAGSTPDTSQPVSSPLAPSSGSTLTSIRGQVSPTALLFPDGVDLYEITLTSGTWGISAASSTQFDPAIFLFRKVISASGEETALPVGMCDDANSTTTMPSLSGGGCTVSLPNALCVGAGTYYLAVAPSGAIPYRCATDPLQQSLFTYTPGQDFKVLPTTSQQNDQLCYWSVPTTSAGGEYVLNFTGDVVVRRSTTPESTLTLGTGVFSYSDPGSTTNAEENRISVYECNGYIPWMVDPVWFRLADCLGTTTIQACPTGSSVNPVSLAVFRGVPGSLTPLACSTVGAPCTALGAEVTFTNLDPEPIFVAFGPLSAGGSVTTSGGTLQISCVPAAPSADINQDGVIDGTDLSLLLSQWGN